MLVSDLLLAAAQKVGVTAANETALQPADQTYIFSELNALLDSWSADNILIPATTQIALVLTPGVQQYLIGPGANPPDFNTTAPLEIVLANCISLANPSQPVRIPMDVYNVQQRGSIPVDNVPSTIVLGMWYMPTTPFGTLFFWPMPTLAYAVELFALYPLVAFVTVGDLVSLRPGYQSALTDNLALRIWAAYRGSSPLPPTLASAAAAGLMRIEAMNAPFPTLSTDSALRGKGNTWLYTTGTYRH